MIAEIERGEREQDWNNLQTSASCTVSWVATARKSGASIHIPITSFYSAR